MKRDSDLCRETANSGVLQAGSVDCGSPWRMARADQHSISHPTPLFARERASAAHWGNLGTSRMRPPACFGTLAKHWPAREASTRYAQPLPILREEHCSTGTRCLDQRPGPSVRGELALHRSLTRSCRGTEDAPSQCNRCAGSGYSGKILRLHDSK